MYFLIAILILAIIFDCPADDLYKPCFYQAKAIKLNVDLNLKFDEQKNCAYLTNRKNSKHPQLSFNPKHRQKIHYEDNQLATIFFQEQFYYLHKKGHSIAVLSYDNWADDFNHGLSRTQQNGKIGFFNQQLEIVIAPQFDWAFPFHQQTARVCIGCKLQQHGEHQVVQGGLWGKIDISGKFIQPLVPQTHPVND